MEIMPVEDVTVLHVDDEPDILELAASVLEHERPAFTVETTTSPEGALDRLEDSPVVDCLVSDYQIPEMDGLELLASVHDRQPGLPFILFTGKGSEEIASEAISAGVTDYIQKETGTDQYTVLANRIENAVAQRRAQEAVETTKRRYETLIRESSDVIAVLDPDGIARYVSPAIERVLGYEPEEVEGMCLFEYVHPDDHDRVEATFDGLTADPSRTPTVEIRFRRGDGSWTRLEAEGRNLLDDEVIEGIVIYGRDVSARAERQQELERYEQIVEIAGDGAYVLDEDGHYEMVNEKTVERTGYSEEELVGTHGSIVFDDEDEQKAKDEILDVFRSEEKDFAQFEVTVRARDGINYPVEIRAAPIVEDGRIVGTVGTSRDIAERKERERELERYEQIVETAGDAANVIDAEGRYVMVNDVLLERTGYDRDEIVGNHVRTVIDDADYERASEALMRVFESDEEEFAELEVTAETAAGEHYPAEVRMAPLVEDGEFVGSVGIIREITDRKRRERELERQNERLGKFATVVSHDLRNPLNVAQARTELARDDPDGDHLDAVSDALCRMERLIDDLLTLAREGRTVEDPQPLDLQTVAKEAWASVATDEATLDVVDDIRIEGDRTRVRQVLENLFRNAIEHGSADVTVSVGPLTVDGFYVADDGTGLGSANPNDIFRANYSTKEDGTGLGLAIVRDIVTAHGWDIRLADGGEDGLCFEIATAPDAEELVEH